MTSQSTFEESWENTKRIWSISTAIAIIGLILIALGNSVFEMPKNISIALIVITVIASLYSLWLLMFYISGFIWGTVCSINPIITIIAIIVFPLLIIPIIIGWYSDEATKQG